jgi:methylenetetrahydrofolate reductase (NADPH)
MSLLSLYVPGRLGLSFELFPPKTPAGEESLWQNVAELAAFQPDFVTCTYGAGGSTRGKTLEICRGVKERFGLPVASHLTCVGSTIEQLRGYLNEAQGAGIDYIVALRGDPPKGEAAFKPVEGGLRYANELVAMIRREFPHFGLLVAGYPEKHQECPSPDVDLDNLKRKVAAGGDVVVTQLFYDNADFFRFRECYDKAGIKAPLVPGILPVTNLSQIQRITSMCGAKLPERFTTALAEKGDDADWQFRAGVDYAVGQVRELLDSGIPGLHFYVLNRSHATAAVLQGVGLRR